MKSRDKEGNRTKQSIKGESVDKIKQRRKKMITKKSSRGEKGCKDGQRRMKKWRIIGADTKR